VSDDLAAIIAVLDPDVCVGSPQLCEIEPQANMICPPRMCDAETDAESLFSIIGGIGVNGVACEQGDPQLMATAQMAARQLISTVTEKKNVGSS